ncbi:hypothetical protein [Georgenia muralis]|uniref:Uncharacterized protein n=1 Tax=Georgenia muralis TaxID=154117 RepID=A0A3N5AB74_9MICO|nr:hypothetical protein [Georgenia muralis]RPF28891.1 hypothetical protein EDD32_3441 [Georgenia muralis]
MIGPGDPDADVRRVGGAPAFVAAHGIFRARRDLTFEQAYGLARLVLELGGGPVPVRGKKAPLRPPTVRVLTLAGLIEQIGDSQLKEWFAIRSTRNYDPTGPAFTTWATSHGTDERTQWFAVATDAGAELVRDHVPGSSGAPGR